MRETRVKSKNPNLKNLKAVTGKHNNSFTNVLDTSINAFTLYVRISKIVLKMVNLGDIFPNFTAESTIGEIRFHEWLGDS